MKTIQLLSLLLIMSLFASCSDLYSKSGETEFFKLPPPVSKSQISVPDEVAERTPDSEEEDEEEVADGEETEHKEPEICEPMKEGPDEIKSGYGLVGTIYDGDTKAILKFEDLLNLGVKMDKEIYLSQLNIPTRKFTEGFVLSDGKLLLNNQGSPLLEYYGLDLTSQLALREEDEPGYYEISMLADDGVIVTLAPEGVEKKTIISTDYHTSTRMSCTKHLVRMEAGKSIPLNVRYFQGPKHHIALIMLWRKVKDLDQGTGAFLEGTGPAEVRCGVSGNSTFFDPESRSYPKAAYLDLLDPTKRIIPWSVVKHENFKLPKNVSNDNCVK